MAVGDSRSRNNRSSKTTTTTQRQKYQTQKKSSLQAFSTTGNLGKQRDKGEEYHSLYAPSGEYNQYMSGDQVGYSVSRGGSNYDYYDMEGNRLYYEGEGESGTDKFTKVENDTKTKVTHSSSTSYKPKDQRNADSKKDSKSKKANLKKKGRSGLRIKLQADPSAGRLKNQKGGKKDKKSGAQGGGKSGLNIPR